MSIQLGTCKRDNLCVDCDSKSCFLAGKLMSDCPLWKCDRTGALYEDCESCELLKQIHNERRKSVKCDDKR